MLPGLEYWPSHERVSKNVPCIKIALSFKNHQNGISRDKNETKI